MDDNDPTNQDQAITWSITQRSVTIKPDDKTKVYGEDDPTLTYSVTEGSLVSPTDLGVMYCSRTEGNNVGEYDITLNYAENANYVVTANTDDTKGKLTISPADLASAQLGTIPNVPYNPSQGMTLPTTTVTYGNATLSPNTDYEFEYSTNETFSSTINGLSEQGTYFARVKAKDGGNYTGTSSVGSFMVTNTVATVTLANGTVSDDTYTTLKEAIDAAENNGIVTLLVPVTESVTVAGKDLTLDLGKSTLTGTDGPAITVAEGATLNLRATDGGSVVAADGQSAIANNGTLDVALGEGKLEGNTAPVIANAGTGNLTMENGFVAYNADNSNKSIQNDGGTATITGGYFTADDAKDYVANGYVLVSATVDGEQWYGLGRSLGGAKLELSPNVVTYNGKDHTPEVAATVTYLGTKLKENDEYSLSWKQGLSTMSVDDQSVGLVNVGTYALTATGVGAYQGSTMGTLTILPFDITDAGQASIGAIPDQKYTGNAITPTLTVADANGNPMTLGTDYTVEYVNNTTGPTAVAKVIGQGNYTGAATVNFKITGAPNTGGNGTSTPTTLVTSITMSPTSMSLQVNKTGQAKVSVLPSNATNKSVTWVSSDTSIATVDANGKVTGKKVGKTTIMAMAKDGSGKSATCAVTVTNPPAPTPTPTPTPVTVAKVMGLSSVVRPAKGVIDAKWKVAAGAKTYQVQWRVAGGKWKSATTESTNMTIRKLKKGKLYEVRVRAQSGSTSGAWSSVNRRWMRSIASLKATGKKSAIKVTWKRDKKANGYKVFVYEKKGGKAVKTASVKAGKTSVTIKGLKSGKKYYIRARVYRTYKGKKYAGAISGYRAAQVK